MKDVDMVMGNFQKRFLLVFSLVLFLLAGCNNKDSDNQTNTVRYQTCWNEALTNENAQCGFYDAQRKVDGSDDETRPVAFAVLPPLGDNPATTPVLYFIGGPGISGVTDYSSFLVGGNSAYLRKQPLILIDYRSVGMSEPNVINIGCNVLPDFEEESGRVAFDNCITQLNNTHFDFTEIRSAVFASDANGLVEALNHSKVIVVGNSYGTRVALTFLRDYPTKVERMVIDGVFPPEVNGASHLGVAPLAALDHGVKKCLTHTECNTHFGDLRVKIENIIAKYVLAFGAPTTADLFDSIAGVAYHPAFPLLIDRLDGVGAEEGMTILTESMEFGDYGSVDANDAECSPGDSPFCLRSFSLALTMGVLCSEESAFAAEQPLTSRYGFSTSVLKVFAENFKAGSPFRPAELADACNNQLTITAADRLEIQPVVNDDVPVLVLSGGRDQQTSPEWGKLAASHLGQSQHILFPMIGHAVSESSECAQTMAAAFIANSEAVLDKSCILGDLDPILSSDDLDAAFTREVTLQHY